MYNKKYLNSVVEVVVDRKMGSKHPKHELFYPINYGFIKNTQAADGEELDAYILGVYKPVNVFSGKCIAIIHRLDDNEDKLIVVPEGEMYTDAEIMALVRFQERFFKSMIIR